MRAHLPLVLLRAACVVATELPTPINKTHHHLGRWYDRHVHTRFDLMFSGHTVLFVLLARAWGSFGLVTVAWWWWALLAAACSFALVVTRQHYSVDVLVGGALAMLTH